MKVGFIGVGGVAQPHLQNLARIRGVKITAVCDVQEERANQAAQAYHATAYTNYRKMLKSEELDACYVCVIPGAHGTIELDLAKANLPFFVEKPVHLNLSACRRVIDQISRSNLITCVGYHWRYTKASQEAQHFVESKGKVSVVEGWWYGGFVRVPWWRQMKLSGGQAVEQTTHIFDMARFLGGEVNSVFAAATTGGMGDQENYDIHDASIATLNFDNGAVGQITSGCISGQAGGPRVEIAAKGREWFAWANGSLARLSDAKGIREVDSKQNWQEQLANGDKAFIAAVASNDGSRILSPYAQGAQTLALTLCVNKSIETGKPVQVPRLV